MCNLFRPRLPLFPCNSFWKEVPYPAKIVTIFVPPMFTMLLFSIYFCLAKAAVPMAARICSPLHLNPHLFNCTSSYRLCSSMFNAGRFLTSVDISGWCSFPWSNVLHSSFWLILRVANANLLSPEGNCESSAREGPLDSLSILICGWEAKIEVWILQL